MENQNNVSSKKEKKQYFTRKNFIAISLAAIFSMLLLFVAVCIDRSDFSKFISNKNLFALMADGFGFKQIEAGIYGMVCVGLIAIYIVVFTIAFTYARRLAVVNGKSLKSGKMIGTYFAIFGICLVLSLGVGLLVQPSLTKENVLNHLIFLGESLAITAIIYVVLFITVGAITMLVINFLKVNKPFEFFNDEDLAEIMKEEDISVNVSDSFDKEEGTPSLAFADAAAAAGAGVGLGMGGNGSATAISSKTELEDREIVFPALSSIDAKYEGYEAEKLESADVTLESLCEGFRNYLAKKEKLYYDIDTIRIFISGLRATRIMLLEGLSGTGKSSLPRYFCEYVGGKATFVAVQATWRDRTNLLGYFNDFSKTYNETDFLKALYEANYDEDRINMFVLDELNISRVEYYFADFLSVLEYPSDEWKLRIMQLPVGFLPPIKLDEGNVQIPLNSYFIGTANKDDSTFTIADKVYDRAITIDFENLNVPFEVEGDAEPITLGYSKLKELLDGVDNNPEYALTDKDLKDFRTVTDFIYQEFDVAFGNRTLNQIIQLAPAFVACGGSKEGALDFILSIKILSKLEGRFESYIKIKLRQLLALINKVYGANVFVRSEKSINDLIKKL